MQHRSGADPSATRLPMLRDDLKLLPNRERVGSTWLVYDPVQHRYIQIDNRARKILQAWTEDNTLTGVAEKLEAESGTPAAQDEIEEFVKFAEMSGLTVSPNSGGWRSIENRRAKLKAGLSSQILHNYLFFRVPLVRPERFLRATLPFVRPFFSRTTWLAIALMGLAGLFLASRQWDQTIAAARQLWSVEGALWFSAALLAVKALHELGHAYSAMRFGCRVPVIGVAFMMLAPLLYTDVTDAWRVPDKRQRLIISAAGICVELGLACIATFAWALLEDGPLRSVAFVIATSGWLLSLTLNLNPFMRFDGYHLLADGLGIENLQERSFAIGRWRLREILFGLGDAPPEAISAKLTRILVAYAWCVWIYRAILFTGIALLVYTYFFKVLGLALFAVEIIYFLASPVLSEIRYWFRQRARIVESRRSLTTLLGLSAGICFFFMPWSARIPVPSILQHEKIVRIYPSRAADIAAINVKHGDCVAKGAILIELTSHEIRHRYQIASVRLALNTVRRQRQASDALDKEESLILEREAKTLQSELDGLAAEQQDLIISAPDDGCVASLNHELIAGRSVGREELLLTFTSGNLLQGIGYVDVADRPRLQQEARGTFWPDDGATEPLDIEVISLSNSGVPAIDIPELASVYGGPVAVDEDQERRLVPSDPQALVRFTPLKRTTPEPQPVRGVAMVQGTPESLAGRAWRHAAGVLIRESGF